MRLALIRFCIVVAWCVPCVVALDTSKLKQQGHVNDFAHEMGTSSRGRLEQYCVQTEQKTGVQLAIVLVNSLDDEPIRDAASKLFREWGVGSKNADQTVLLLFAVQDKQEGAQVGSGLESILPADFIAGALARTRLALQDNDYNQPLLALAQKIGERIAKAKGVSLDPPKSNKSGWFSPIAILLYICIAAFIAGLLSIVPAFMKLAAPTAKSPTTWLTIVLSVLLVILFNFIGHDAAQRVLPSGLLNFFESAWPMLALVLVFILLGSKGHPWDYFVGAVSGRSRGKHHR
jgi:uncharacterized membrane protein YgcG